MDTRPTPTGWQHWLELRLRHAPDPRHTDPARALADLETGLEQPVVEVTEQHADGGVTVRIGVFSDSAEPNRNEIAAIEGMVAELLYADRM